MLVEVKSIKRKLFVNYKGNDVEVKQVEDYTVYNDKVVIFTKQKTKGNTEEKYYCVSVDDFIPSKKKSTKEYQKDKITSLLAQGFSSDEVIKMLIQ